MAIFQKKNPNQIDDRSISIEKYLDLAITDGFSSLRESAMTKNLSLGFQVLEFAGYQSEILARAKGLIEVTNDPLSLDDYEEAIALEAKYLRSQGVSDDLIESRLAAFKIAFILKQNEDTKPKAKEMRT